MAAEGVVDFIDLTFDYIGGFNSSGQAYCPPHGSTECVVDKYNLCAQKATSDISASWSYMSCLYERQDDLKCGNEDDCCDTVPCPAFDKIMDTVNQKCAIAAKLSPELLDECATGQNAEGEAWQRQSYAVSAKAGIIHPSWMWIDGTLVDQPLGKTTDKTGPWAKNVLTAICTLIEKNGDTSPKGCASVLQKHVGTVE